MLSIVVNHDYQLTGCTCNQACIDIHGTLINLTKVRQGMSYIVQEVEYELKQLATCVVLHELNTYVPDESDE